MDGLSTPRASIHVSLGEPCPVCQEAMTRRHGVALTGEQFCDRHLQGPYCVLCGMPAASAPGWTVDLCRRCETTAVRTQDDVKRELPSIRRELRALGIRSVTPFQIQLVTRSRLTQLGPHHTLGLTLFQGARVVDVLVVKDLPRLKFGSVVAHEVMHAYMAQHDFGRMPAPIEEGLCQMLAYAWIIRQPEPLAAAERRHIEENPDVVYGDGFRAVKAAVQQVGVRTVLNVVKRSQRLP